MAAVTGITLDRRVAAVRRFNRFYTALIGLLNESYLDSSWSLTEVRVLYELARRGQATAAELGRDLDLDRGYLSRVVRRFSAEGLVNRARSGDDGRRRILSLSDRGHQVFETLDLRSRRAIASVLERHGPAEQQQVIESMASIERTLTGGSRATETLVLRPPASGDLGWVVQRHGALYAQEYGWDQSFEALVAEIVAGFALHRDPATERCWIAELGGQNVGSVFCVRRSEAVAQLRLLLVEPHARGLGIGGRLVGECVEFARSAGYRTVMLWTNDVLVAARRIYEAAGFKLIEEDRHHSFGHDLVGQNWELEL